VADEGSLPMAPAKNNQGGTGTATSSWVEEPSLAQEDTSNLQSQW